MSRFPVSKQEEAKFKQIFDRISDILIKENLSPKASLILLSAMSEALYTAMVNDPEKFVNSNIQTVLYGGNENE